MKMIPLSLRFLSSLLSGIIVACIVFFLVSVPSAHAATTQIFSSGSGVSAPQMDGNYIVWSAQDTSGINQVYLYDVSSGQTTQLTQLISGGAGNALVKDGKITWLSNDGNGHEGIFLYDIASGVATEIANLSQGIWSAQIGGNYVVWGTPGYPEVYLYNIATGTTTQIANNGQGFGPFNSPLTDGNWVVWTGNDGLYLYNISTSTTIKIAGSGSYLTIDNGLITWAADDGSHSAVNIFLYDTSTGSTTQVSSIPSQTTSVVNNGKVAWAAFVGTAVQIYLYDIASGTTTQVTNDSNNLKVFMDNPLILKDNKVIWNDVDTATSQWEIKMYDIASGITTQITPIDDNNYVPAYGNGKIAYRHNNAMFLWSPDNNLPVLSDITSTTVPVQVNTPIAASATFADADTSDTHTAVWDWGDGTTDTCPANTASCTLTEASGSGSLSGTHSYTAPGTYTITLTVTDSQNGQATKTYQYISVYDNHTNSVSGSKEYTTPAGSVIADPTATGKTNFGFTAQYDSNGNVVPQGSKWASVSFKSGQTTVDFTADTYTSLLIDNGKITLRGTGTYNNQTGYTLLLTAIEATSGSDLVRYQIKDSSGNVVYDTQPGDADSANPTTPVTKGKISIK